jgi:hypothetical protein
MPPDPRGGEAGSLPTGNLKLETVLSSADKVHDLQMISVREFGLSPLRARDNFAIKFDGHAIALHAKLFDQFGQRQGIGKTLFVTVDE